MRSATFRDMLSAPKDGTVIEVRHGPGQEVVRARWSGQGQAWVGENDPLRRSLHRITGWRPATGAPRPFRSITSAPTDVAVEVIHGTRQAVTVAKWDPRRQLWVRADDPERGTLSRVTGWRLVLEKG